MSNSNIETQINDSIIEIKREIGIAQDINSLEHLETRTNKIAEFTYGLTPTKRHKINTSINEVLALITAKKNILDRDPTIYQPQTIFQPQYQQQFQPQYQQQFQPQYQQQFPQGQNPQGRRGLFGLSWGGKKTYRNKKNRKTKRKLRRKSRKSGGR
jgi:hypothetical protein